MTAKITHGVQVAGTIRNDSQVPNIAARADWKRHTEEATSTLSRFNENAHDIYDPIERLRFFCSLAMSGQDWLDVEPLFEAVAEYFIKKEKT